MNQKIHTCPCPNLECPNHGVCEDCTSRHLRKGTLNYCGFHSILHELEAAVAADPDSPAAAIIQRRIDCQSGAYAKLQDQHEISEEQQTAKREAKSQYSDH